MTGEVAKSSDPALAQRATGFARYAGFYGVPASAFEQVFTWLGQRYRLSLFSPALQISIHRRARQRRAGEAPPEPL